MEHALALKIVMAGLVPAIHVCASSCIEDVDARPMAGHDGDLTVFDGARP